jgi:hypothetical protein
MMSEQRRAPNWHARVFFGLHYDLHAHANDTELGKDVTPEMLRAAWEKIRPDWVQCDCKGHPGYTSWPTKVGYASPGIVRDALRIHREVTRELGLPLVMHYSGLWDEAAIQHHPDWARVTADGTPERGRACPRSGYLTELLIPQMLEIIDTYDVDGFWVDGDLWVARPCYCARCRNAFTAETSIAEPPRAAGEPGWEAWLAFHRRSYKAYARAYIEAVHRRKPECLVCINWAYSVLQPDPVALPVDFLSGDFSHAWGVERAAVEARMLTGRGLPWDLMAWGFTTGEGGHAGWHFKTVAHLCQEVAEVIACGGAVCIYIHPPRSGHLVRWEHEVVAEVAQFCRARQEITQGSVSVPQAVVLHSKTHYYAHNDPLYGRGQATQPLEGALHALLDTGYHVDIQTEEGLLERLTAYELVVVAEQDPLPDGVVAELARYVQQGGRLVLSGAHLAWQPGLAALAGVEAAGEPRQGFHYLPVDDAAVTVAGPWQPVRLRDATAWAALLYGPEPGKHDTGIPAITLRESGRGLVAAIHGPLFAAYYRTRYPRLRSLLRQLFRAVWPDPMVELAAPAHVVLTLRRQLGRTIVHLLNRGADPATSPRNVMVERVPPVGPLTLRLRLPQRPAAVRVIPDAGARLRWDWADGAAEVELSQLGIHTAVVFESP